MHVQPPQQQQQEQEQQQQQPPRRTRSQPRPDVPRLQLGRLSSLSAAPAPAPSADGWRAACHMPEVVTRMLAAEMAATPAN